MEILSGMRNSMSKHNQVPLKKSLFSQPTSQIELEAIKVMLEEEVAKVVVPVVPMVPVWNRTTPISQS
jgi:hypothetical protein